MLKADLERILAIAKDSNKEITTLGGENVYSSIENHQDCIIEGNLLVIKDRGHAIKFIEISAIHAVRLTEKGTNDKKKEDCSAVKDLEQLGSLMPLM